MRGAFAKLAAAPGGPQVEDDDEEEEEEEEDEPGTAYLAADAPPLEDDGEVRLVWQHTSAPSLGTLFLPDEFQRFLVAACNRNLERFVLKCRGIFLRRKSRA